MKLVAGFVHPEHGFQFCEVVQDVRHIRPLMRAMRRACEAKEEGWMPMLLYDYRTHKAIHEFDA